MMHPFFSERRGFLKSFMGICFWVMASGLPLCAALLLGEGSKGESAVEMNV